MQVKSELLKTFEESQVIQLLEFGPKQVAHSTEQGLQVLVATSTKESLGHKSMH